MNTFILIMFLATSASSQSGAASVAVEFTSKEKCMAAGKALTVDAVKRHNYVLTWACVKK